MSVVLSNAQQKIVDYDGSSLLVIAGAGSGKTRVLIERILKLTTSLKRGEKVLAITFSNKAKDELIKRLSNYINVDTINEKIYVGTIHNFCFEIVRLKGHLIGLPENLHICESNSDKFHMFKEAIESVPEFKSKYLGTDANDNSKKISELLERLSAVKRELKFSSDYSHKPEVQHLLEEYDNMLLRQCVIDYDDILRYAYQILIERASVLNIYRKVYKYICVDEAQDLNKAQYEIIKLICAQGIGITMVGDPNQSIYGFNGSNSDYFVKYFIQDFSAKKLELNENYRSSKSVIQAASKIEKSFIVNSNCKYDGEFTVSKFKSEHDEAEYVVGKIIELNEHGHKDIENNDVSFEQCMVVARNKYILKSVEELLIQKNIPYVLKVASKGGFTSESDLMKAFELGIMLINNHSDKIHLNELCKLISKKIEVNTFDEIRNYSNLPPYWEIVLPKLNEIWTEIECGKDSLKFDSILRLLEDYIEHFKDENNQYECLLALEDIKQWNDHWHNYLRKSQLGERTLLDFTRAISLGKTSKNIESGVTLSTVHMAKGTEYDVVFVIGMNEGIFPDYRAIKTSEIGIESKQLIEERHNMFVAITRAKRLCYVSYPTNRKTKFGNKEQKRSRYIDDLLN